MTQSSEPLVLTPASISPVPVSSSPFGDALAALARSGSKGGFVTRYDIYTGDLKAALAIKVLDSAHFDLELGAEFTWERSTHHAAGYVGLEGQFDW